ncbi:hypothetical protein TREMEDRAFT_63757 [Tremella mesenterica DSM 1558]|uniref:uncharacterized protein n=1 Tax=Tremella mesenterica (strain ATCC 24925 / CBS 8224 / DSM 1558 / NBRC 9311 / NRRL Y-6157 / RJB 2259-6 / UBC 559-6) TaxID=578456 RepID=UPI0003F49797|nr:uncharacterized protein TREMEDRAFT_63757 [Tremella mesenterica DSM 1558]EIW67866.1 hypothetical protein TREMEDRAFT_63757 [Tremella mesenterica DSM 1558]
MSPIQQLLTLDPETCLTDFVIDIDLAMGGMHRATYPTTTKFRFAPHLLRNLHIELLDHLALDVPSVEDFPRTRKTNLGLCHDVIDFLLPNNRNLNGAGQMRVDRLRPNYIRTSFGNSITQLVCRGEDPKYERDIFATICLSHYQGDEVLESIVDLVQKPDGLSITCRGQEEELNDECRSRPFSCQSSPALIYLHVVLDTTCDAECRRVVLMAPNHLLLFVRENDNSISVSDIVNRDSAKTNRQRSSEVSVRHPKAAEGLEVSVDLEHSSFKAEGPADAPADEITCEVLNKSIENIVMAGSSSPPSKAKSSNPIVHITPTTSTIMDIKSTSLLDEYSPTFFSTFVALTICPLSKEKVTCEPLQKNSTGTSPAPPQLHLSNGNVTLDTTDLVLKAIDPITQTEIQLGSPNSTLSFISDSTSDIGPRQLSIRLTSTPEVGSGHFGDVFGGDLWGWQKDNESNPKFNNMVHEKGNNVTVIPPGLRTTPIRVAIKICMPTLSKRYAPAQAKEVFLHEAKMYQTALKPLQGSVVPRCYGVFCGAVKRYSRPGAFSMASKSVEKNDSDSQSIYILVLDRLGLSVSDRSPAFQWQKKFHE